MFIMIFDLTNEPNNFIQFNKKDQNNIQFKGTAHAFKSDPLFIECNVQFTTALFKPLYGQ